MYLDTPTQGWVTAVCVLFCIIYFLFFIFYSKAFAATFLLLFFPGRLNTHFTLCCLNRFAIAVIFMHVQKKNDNPRCQKKRNDSDCCLARIVCLWMKHGLDDFHYNWLCCMLLMVCHFRKNFYTVIDFKMTVTWISLELRFDKTIWIYIVSDHIMTIAVVN